MRRYVGYVLILFVLSVFNTTGIFSQDDLPSIVLPKIDIEIEDLKVVGSELIIDDSILTDIEFDAIPRPDFSEDIKVDLEKTLPQQIILTEEQKPVDALILFGYGLNNNLYADFSIFVKQYNPKVAIHYLRNAKETMWFDRSDIKNSYSLDDLTANILYNYKNFNLGAELEYFNNSYGLQDTSIFNDFTKRILNIDLGPAFKFNYNNDLTLRVSNSFLFTDAAGEIDNKTLSRGDFDYLLQTDIVYTQVLGKNHFITANAGYDFNFFYSLTSGQKGNFTGSYNEIFYNTIKAGVSYSTTLMDAFLLKASVIFDGTFKNDQFYWHIVPFGKFGYSFQDYFHCYVEGGARLIEKPDSAWYKEQMYAVFPFEDTPGYHWYARTGLKGSFTGWITATTDLEFAYNQDGNDWKLVNSEEQLYTHEKWDFMELNLESGLTFRFREYLEMSVFHKHYFLDRIKFSAQDEVTANISVKIPPIGLSMYVDFEGQFVRYDGSGEDMGNVYLMNAGIDWDYQERIGLGAMFNNILYFQKHQFIPGYDEPGFEFIAYLKIGF